jgi:alpha-tubulin suppressor-like RCC1 family protein
MFTTHRQVLREKKGFATVFMLGAMAVIVMFSVGVAIVNYSTQTALVSQTQNLTAAVKSRAESFIGDLNKTPSAIAVTPSVAAVADTRTGLITSITSVTPAADGLSEKLVIKSTTTNGVYNVTRAVTIFKTNVTHISGFDTNNQPIWTDTKEANSFSLWSVAAGSIRPLTTVELAGEKKDATTWLWASDRLGLDSTGHLWAWGANDQGQTGTGTVSTTPLPVPKAVTPGATYRSATSDGTSAWAVDSAGKLWAWGDNASGKLGTGDTADRSSPTAVASYALFLEVTSSGNSTFALDVHGRIWAWGANGSGLLGTGSAAASLVTPALVPNLYATDIVTSAGSTYALDANDQLWVWGLNGTSQLGLGTTTTERTPQKAGGTTAFSSVSAANFGAAAIDTSGKIWAWGRAGSSGSLSWPASTTPVQIPTSTTFSSVTVGKDTLFAVDSFATLWAWHSNANGEYGNGTLTPSLAPTKIAPGVEFRDFWSSANSKASTGLDTNGGLWSFGHNGTGAWTTTNTVDVNSAVKMPSPIGFVQPGWN